MVRITDLKWASSHYVPHAQIAHAGGTTIMLYHNPQMLPHLWTISLPFGTAWSFRSHSLAEEGALRLINLHLAQKELVL